MAVGIDDFIRFSNNSAGVEKILKGLQGICQLINSPSAKIYLAASHGVRKQWGAASQQIGLGRKLVRFLWFIDSAFKTEQSRKGRGGYMKWIIFGKWFC